MQRLSEHASLVLARMEPDRRYEPQDLAALVPNISMEALREVMHELWVNRQVERVDYTAWKRQRSAAPDPDPAPRGPVEIIAPEDLFDHARFSGFFK